MKTKPISRLYKHIKKNTAKLNSFYYGIPRGKLHNADPKCFTDNYSIIDRHCKSVTAELAALKSRYNIRAGKDGLPFLYGIIKELAANKTPDTQSIAEKLCEYNPSFDEISLTALFLGCAYIEKLCRRMTEGRSAADVLNELRELDCIDFEELFAKCSDAERILLSDSAYELSDEETKCFFRRMISDTALKTGKSEKLCCTELFGQAEKQGTSVIKLLEKRDILSKHGKAVLCAELVIPFLLSAAAGVFFKNAVVFLLCFLPLQELTKVLVTDNYTAKKSGRILPKVRNDSGLIKDAGTVITVSSLLPDADGAEEMKKHLKKLYLCSKEYKVRVCLLADLDESETAETPKDSEKIKTAEKMTDELNAEFPDRFMLFVRKRSYIKTQGNYSGYERKRGAVEEFLRYIKSEEKNTLDKNYLTVYGATENLNGFDYALALDSDTELTRTTLGSLLRAALHPLNKAVLSADGKSVIDGFGIFMSKIETDIRSAYKTVFSVIQVGTGGVSAYDGKCSERYFDLFAKSVFTGKGLIDISAYNSVIEGKFKPETVLSHDIIEGEFIGTALDGESCFTDRFPSGEASFLMRAHRWIRGDVQNIIYLFDKRLDGVSRFKLADNLRRALLPVNVVFNLLVALFLPSDIRTFTVLVSLFAFTSGEISRILNCLFYMGIKGTAIRYFGDALPELLLGFSRFLYKFFTLPKTAWNSLDAVLRSLYRVFISRKKLLEWKTAAQSEKTDDTGILSAYNIFQMLISLLFIAVPDTLFRILGLCFLTGVFSTALTSHGNKKSKRKPCRADTELLTDFARRMWKFYTDNCVLDNNYLPPDNVQTAPVFRTAYRTSPTNIGMYLMSALCARDMGFIDSTELYERLSQTLKTVEKLPKYKGNLYNWYDIKTLAPLTLEFVSLVDSGNLLCCLTALRQGVKEYYAEMPALREISDFCTCFEKECDIGFMYNDRKNLFHIGYNRTDKKLSPSYYDLLMSEARMTGYYAVARGTVPVRHWQSLSRAMTSYKGFSGAASWGGTVFEYFLPDLFMPSYKNTLCWESLRYCLMCQRAYSGRYGIPFGISESGYYKFDGDMNYQYKAHGVNRLSMKRESFDERVVSPYSSFLTLAFAPVASLNNIVKLSRYDSLGIYGFYEALDFSERRCYPSEYQTVKSFMAHHLGMSIVGICNYLFDGIMQKRFMRDDEMLSCESLLTEKISRGNVFLNTDRSRERVKRSRVRSRFDEVKYSAPKTAVYSNGEYSLVISDNGAGFSKYKMLNATSKNSDYLFKPVGVFAFFKSDGRVIPLQRATDCNSDRFYFCRFMKTGARLYAVDRKISAVTDISVMRNIPAELRTYRIKNNFRKRIRGDLYIYFEPSLDFDASEKTHRAFSRLFTVGRKENGTVIFERNRRDNGGGKLYCACGFTDGRDFKCCLSREKALQRKGGIFTLNSLKKFSSCEDGKIDCCAFIKIPVTAEAHRAINIQFFICTADNYDELKDSVRFLTERGKKTHTNFAEPVTDTDSRTESLVSSLIYCAEKSAVISGNCNRSLLWRFGISGDYPLIIFNSIKNTDRSDLIYALRLNRRLNGTGIFTEIAVICASGEENGIKALINTESPLTLSKRGGAHIIKREQLNGEEMQYIYNFAVCALGENEIKDFSESKNNRLEIMGNSESAGKNEMLPDGYRIAEKGRLPWCYCISNGTFGTLLSDKSLGYTFFGNSYLNALTRRSSDTAYDMSETLYLKTDSGFYDIPSVSEAVFGRETAEYYAFTEGLGIKCSVAVPQSGSKKTVRVIIENKTSDEKSAVLSYYCEPMLSSGNPSAIKYEIIGNMLVLNNSENTDFMGFMGLSANSEKSLFATVRSAFFAGEFENLGNRVNGCAAVGREIKLKAGEKAEAVFTLCYARTKSALRMINLLDLKPRRIDSKITVDTGIKSLDLLVNEFLPNQIIDARLNMRSGFYQCSGAYGFRDQLQDSLAVIMTYPEKTARQILRSAAVQFREGDALHWWHCVGGVRKGIRSRYSDDVLWLVYCVSEYVLKTGDTEILKKEIPYLDGEPLSDGENDRYSEYRFSDKRESLLMHLFRAADKALEFGEHSLLLMQGGDWNDGMNLVGIRGRGESVWLSEFACAVLTKFSEVLGKTGCFEKAEKYLGTVKKLRQSIDLNAFENDRYIRAFDDSSEKIGSKEGKNCRIDILTQSFASLGGMPDKKKIRTALETAEELLCDKQNGIIRLLSPAFDMDDKNIGYITAYPEGIRENGGQYTHAAVWYIKALIKEGFRDKAFELIQMINPLARYESGDKRLGTEPYYLCGDVLSARHYEGRGNWSIYTGSAAWLYTVIVEDLLGLKMKDGSFYLESALPEKIKNVTLTLTADGKKTVFKSGKNQ